MGFVGGVIGINLPVIARYFNETFFCFEHFSSFYVCLIIPVRQFWV
jgi:hypothetical protein